MTKSERIQEAYGDQYEAKKDKIDENGWNQELVFEAFDLDLVNYDYKAVGHGIYVSRPLSIKGIEHNHGWIKITDENDLPMIESENFKVVDKDNSKIYEYHFKPTPHMIDYWLLNFSHWKTFQEEKLPIY